MVLAFPAADSVVFAFEAVNLELSQERLEPCLAEGLLEDRNDCVVVIRVLASVGVNLERLSIGHPGNDVVVAVSLGVFEHVVEAFWEDRGSLCSLSGGCGALGAVNAASAAGKGSGAGNSLLNHDV